MARKSPILDYDPEPPKFAVSPEARSIIIVAFLVVVVFATFQGVCENQFAGFDDHLTLYGNPRLHPLPPETVSQSALWYWKHPEFSLYVPVTYQVWAALVPFAQLPRPGPDHADLAAGVFHAANLCFHLLNVIAAYLVLRLLVQRDWIAGIAALAYGLHPLQVEAVAWASGLKDVLCGLGMMLALWQYLLFASAHREKFAARRFKHAWIHYVLAMLFLLVAMLCKPSAMMMPIIAGILDWLIIGRPLRKVVVSIVPLLVAIAPLVIVAKLVQGGSAVDTVALWQRPFIATDALAFYLYKLALPFQLAACYARRPALVLEHGWLWWTWIFPAMVVVAICLAGKNRRWLAAGAGVMLAALAPVLGLTAFDYQRISTVADHYMYVAMLGPALIVGFALARAAAGWPRRICVSLALLVVLGYAALSTIQVSYWHDQLALWSHAVAVAPESHTAHVNLGAVYQGIAEEQAQATWLRLAESEYARAVQLDPDDFSAQNGLAAMLALRHRPNEALEHMKRAVEIEDRQGVDPHAPNIGEQIRERLVLAQEFLRRGRPADAIEFYQSVLRIDPQSKIAADGLKMARAAATTQPASAH
ncbi:MAG TPA: hypothetical protein VFE47_10330 [Tepidisphaeraceae bacterium]|jgi:tetratricopeptide (TPR) repeat protein|nr:hypothetical protein [Tepidisphaeraceae bacterium]